MKDSFDYCLKNEILGVGWQIDSTKKPASWDAYIQEAEQIYDNLQVPKYIKKWVSEGDLDFTRFSRHLLRSKLNWRISYEASQISGGI